MLTSIHSSRAKRSLDAPAECTKCHIVQSPYEFPATKYATLGSWCKTCINADTRKKRQLTRKKSTKKTK